MTLHNVISGLGKALKWGFISLVIMFGLLLLINAVDEDPSPEMEALLIIPQIKVDPDNGYLALAGINAPPGEDIVSYGTQWVDTYNTVIDSTLLEKADTRFPRAAAPKFEGNKNLLCNPYKLLCLPQAREHTKEWRKLAADNELMLARYRRLLEFSHFDESYFPMNIGSNFPSYHSHWKELALNMIALDAAEGRLVPAVATLESHIAFDRRALLGSRSLIMGMMVTSWLRQDYALLAEIVATDSKLLFDQKARLIQMSTPLEIEQLREVAGRLFEGEIRYRLRSSTSEQLFSQDAGNNSKWFDMLARPFYKERAVQNRIAREFTSRQIIFLEFTPENTEGMIAQLRQVEQNEAEADPVNSWRILYNPAGNLVWVSLFRFETYILRLSDLMGISRSARLQVEVVMNGNADADLPG